MKKILLCLVFVLVAGSAYAVEKEIKARFAYNGIAEGFRLYMKAPSDVDFVMIKEEADPSVREIIMTVDFENGRNLFTLTAFIGTEESFHSEEFPFEYLHYVTLPAPQLVIELN